MARRIHKLTANFNNAVSSENLGQTMLFGKQIMGVCVKQIRELTASGGENVRHYELIAADVSRTISSVIAGRERYRQEFWRQHIQTQILQPFPVSPGDSRLANLSKLEAAADKIVVPAEDRGWFWLELILCLVIAACIYTAGMS